MVVVQALLRLRHGATCLFVAVSNVAWVLRQLPGRVVSTWQGDHACHVFGKAAAVRSCCVVLSGLAPTGAAMRSSVSCAPVAMLSRAASAGFERDALPI